MTRAYVEFTGETETFAEVARAAKDQIMRQELVAEVDRLTSLLAEICDRHRRHRDHTRRELRDAVRELVARYPVYRTYVTPGRPPSVEDRRQVSWAVAATLAGAPQVDRELVRFMEELALGDRPGDRELEFALRLQQLTAPVMAKGVEDTAFYRYHRLVALNEVGGDPGVFGRSVADFHLDTARSSADWPDAMLTLSTHDTKRSGAPTSGRGCTSLSRAAPVPGGPRGESSDARAWPTPRGLRGTTWSGSWPTTGWSSGSGVGATGPAGPAGTRSPIT